MKLHFASGIIAILVGADLARAQAFFQVLGYSARAISGDGRVVVGYAWFGEGGVRAIRWTRLGGIQALGDLPGGDFSEAEAVSADGSFVAGTGSSTAAGPDGWEAFRWNLESGMIGLGDLNQQPGREFRSVAYGVSDNGAVVGYGDWDRPMKWTPESGMTNLSGTSWGVAFVIAGDGAEVGGELDDDDSCAENPILWNINGGSDLLQTLPWCNFEGCGWEPLGRVFDISADGSTSVGMCAGQENGECRYHAVAWTPGLVDLGGLPGSYESQATAVSGDGSVILGHSASPIAAFILTPDEGMQSLKDVLLQRGARGIENVDLVGV